MVLTGTKTGELKIFYLSGEKLWKTLKMSSNTIFCMAASKENMLAVQIEPNQITIVSLVEERMEHNTLQPFDFSITNFTFSPFNPSLLAVAGDDGSITVLYITCTEASMKIHFSVAHVSPVALTAFSPTNPCLLCSIGLDKRLCFFDVEKKKKRIRVFPLNDYCECFHFSNCGSHLIISFQGGQLSVFDLRGGIQQRCTINTNQVIIHSIGIFNKEMLTWTALSNNENYSKEKENISSMSNQLDNKDDDGELLSSPSRVAVKDDSRWTDKLLLDKDSHSFSWKESNETSQSIENVQDHLSESPYLNWQSWMKDATTNWNDNISNRQEQLSETKDVRVVDSDIPTIGNLSRPLSASWDETPIVTESKSNMMDDDNPEITSRLVSSKPFSFGYPNPFPCLLSDASREPIESTQNNSAVANNNNNSNVYSCLLQSIEDIQYGYHREIKQHIQNLHIDVIRNFEEQQVSG